MVTHLDLTEFIYQCQLVSIVEDMSKTQEELIEEIRALHQQAHTLCNAFQLQEVSADAANAHCTIIRCALVDS